MNAMTLQPGQEWAPGAVEVLKVLWAQGERAERIAQLFGTTRSAVSGKVKRLGLTPRSPAKASAIPEPRTKISERVLVKAHLYAPMDWMNPVSLLEAATIHCRWPIGEALFCGCPKVKGPYCEDHAALAYE